MMLAKLSILRLYLTLFPGRKTRIAIMITMFAVVISSTVIIITQVSQCRPINRAWNKDQKGTCLDLNMIALASAGVNIGQDTLILLIPFPILTNLTIALKQKIGMLFIFGLYSL